MKTNFKALLIGSTVLISTLSSTILGMNPQQTQIVQIQDTQKPQPIQNATHQDLYNKLCGLTTSLISIKNQKSLNISERFEKIELALAQLSSIESFGQSAFSIKEDKNEFIKRSTEVRKQYISYKKELKRTQLLATIKKYGKNATFSIIALSIAALAFDALLKDRMIGNYHVGTASSCVKNFIIQNASKFYRWAKYTQKELDDIAQAQIQRMMLQEQLVTAKTCLESTKIPLTATIDTCTKKAFNLYNTLKRPTQGYAIELPIPYGPGNTPEELFYEVNKLATDLKASSMAKVINPLNNYTVQPIKNFFGVSANWIKSKLQK